MDRPMNRKVREGIVVSTKMQKTAIVAIQRLVKHPRYKKTMRQTKRLAVHDPEGLCANGDVVQIVETRPLSATKRWRIVRMIRKAVQV